MRNNSSILLLSAGIILSLAGCQKGTETGNDGQFVRFGASSGAVNTRTSYGEDGDGYQMIDWSEGDQILVWSDNAINRDGRSGQSAVYNLLNITKQGRESVANVNRATEDGLVYLDDNTTRYQFWGIYPANAYKVLPTAGSVSFTVSADQKRSGDAATTDGGIVENPDMQKAVMLATSQKVGKGGPVDLKFYPAYTAFEFELKNNTADAITLKDVTLSSGSGETAGILAGDVTATLSTPDQPATLALMADGTTSTKVKYTFGNGSPVEIAVGKSLKFTVFTTGVAALNGLSADFTYGSGVVRHVTFKKNKQDITFTACRKYRLLGIMMKEDWYFAELNLEGQPINWFDSNVSTDNKNYPEATQFNVTGAYNYYWDPDNENWAQDEKWRQYWLMGPDDIATVTFKVLSPVGYYWLVEVVDPDDAFIVAGNGTAENGLKGLINNKKTVGEGEDAVVVSTTTNVVLTIKASDEGKTGEHKLYLRTYAVSADGNTKYSLDSETQTNDLVTNPEIGPRGYHYFILNNSTIVNRTN